MADVWQYPKSWAVGDTLDANTLNTWLRDQNRLLLRRPLTVATSSSNQTLPVAGSGNTVVQYNTIVQDDDGMALQATPVTDFYAHRAGTYQIWANLDFTSLASGPNFMMSVAINGTNLLYRQQHRMGPATVAIGLGVSGTLFMNVGEFVQIQAWNGDATNTMTMGATNNCPRICIMWLGPT